MMVSCESTNQQRNPDQKSERVVAAMPLLGVVAEGLGKESLL